MRNYPFIAFISLISLVGLQACDRNNSDQRASVDPLLLEGVWVVERFQSGLINETEYFRNIRFRFQANGDFIVMRVNNELTRGNWELLDGKRSLDIWVPDFVNEEQAAQRFGDEIYEVHDDWNILEFSSNRMRMKSDNETFTLVRQ